MAKRLSMLGVALGVMLAWSWAAGGIVEGTPYVEIWTDRGDGSLYVDGEAVEVLMRPAYDCYVIIYEIDTDGYLRVLFPYDCEDDGYVVGGRVYRVGGDRHRRLYVRGPSGVEYVHVVASFEPFRQLYWHGCNGYSDYALEVTWRGFSDYWGCALPARIYGDPYIAMQSIDEFICLDALEVGLVWADFTHFYVGEQVHYPRYLCYDCHGYNTRVRPYVSVCTGFSITFIDCDPCFRPWSWWWWCSPKRVYCGPRYVCYSRKRCPSYPSVYKWKSKVEDDFGRSAVKVRSGNIDNDVRVKSKRKAKDLDLYARGEPRGAAKRKEVRVTDTQRTKARSEPVRAAEVKAKSRSREAPAPPAKPAVKIQKRKASKPSEPNLRESQRSQRSVRTSKSGNKKVRSQVRTKDKGRSPATRRRVSR